MHVVTPRYSTWRSGASCLALLLLTHTAFSQSIHRFDFGPEASEIEPGHTLVTPASVFDAGRGFGWSTPPAAAFARPDLYLSRSVATQDGVSGNDLAFDVRAGAGDWWVTLWMEAGLEDSSTVRIAINDEERPTGWLAVHPQAEPRSEIQAIYRVFHDRVTLDTDRFRLRLTAGQDSVRLLALTLVPVQASTTPELAARLAEAGRYPANAPIEALLFDLQAHLATTPNDAWAAQALIALQQLYTAEQLIDLLGWTWADEMTGLGLFERYYQAAMLLDAVTPVTSPEDSPLFERARWQRGRLLYWLARERGGRHERVRGAEDLALLYRRHPDDGLLAMYNGERIARTDACDDLAYTNLAPAWAVAQVEARCRLTDLAHWWVAERQDETGELGGKLDDDIEMLRWWAPLVQAGDTLTLRGWKRLAEAVWQSGLVENGYASRVRDVEHASELIADTAPQLALFDDDPVYRDRLRPTVTLFDSLWTRRSDAGRRFFRSAWFSASEVDTREPRNRDVEMNTRAAKALRYHAYLTRDTTAIRLLHEWSTSWVNAAMRTDKGKPAGLIPASVRFPDEAINGDGATWHEAGMLWDYYDWRHSAGSMMLDQLYFTYTLTRDDRMLAPMKAALDLVARHRNEPAADQLPAGTAPWAAAVLRASSAFWSVVETWRLQTGDTTYDALILAYGTPYTRYRITGDARHLVAGLDDVLDVVRFNTPLLTDQALHTDRVYVARPNTPGAAHLAAMLTGDGTPDGMSPYPVVAYSQLNKTTAALVTDSAPRAFGVDLYELTTERELVEFRLWHLSPGDYRLRYYERDKELRDLDLHVARRGQRLLLSIPGQTLTRIEIEPKN